MKKHLLFIVVFLVCLFVFLSTYISFDTKQNDLKFTSFPTFEEEGFIVKPNK